MTLNAQGVQTAKIATPCTFVSVDERPRTLSKTLPVDHNHRQGPQDALCFGDHDDHTQATQQAHCEDTHTGICFLKCLLLLGIA